MLASPKPLYYIALPLGVQHKWCQKNCVSDACSIKQVQLILFPLDVQQQLCKSLCCLWVFNSNGVNYCVSCGLSINNV